MFKVMIVEDEEKLGLLICENLQKWAFDVKLLHENFENMIEILTGYSPHVVLMDINLPQRDGFYWCSKIREVSKIPIIFISSRNSNMDIIMSMNMGGDDFIQKPFSMEILIAKINAMLRRTYSYSNEQSNTINYKDIVLNLSEASVSYNSQKVALTKNEFKILQLLLKHTGKIISRDEIMSFLWESESFVDDNTLTVNINRLRKKISSLGLNEFVETRKGQGYIIL